MRKSALLLTVFFSIFLAACASVPAANSTPLTEDTSPSLPNSAEPNNTPIITPTAQSLAPRPPPKPPPPKPSLTTPSPTPPPTPNFTIEPANEDPSISIWTEWGTASFGKDYPATPGTRIDFVKAGEGTSPDGKPTSIYVPVSTGLPKDNVYYVWYKALRQNSPAQMSQLEMTIGDKGYVIPSGKSTAFAVSCYSFAKGEARVFALMTADKSIIAYGKIMLYPIQAKISNSRIWVELLASTGEMFAVYGEGFEPYEELEVTSNSAGEVAQFKNKADGNGRFTNIVLPAVVGKQSGSATYTVAAKVGTLTVSFDWGPPALNPGP